MGEVLNSRESILSAVKRRVQRVHLKSLDADVHIKPLSGAERAQIGDTYRELGDKASLSDTSKKIGYRTVALALVDDSGKRIFDPDKDLDDIGGMDAGVLDEISDLIQELSGLSKTSVEQAAKNSPSAPSGGSSSV